MDADINLDVLTANNPMFEYEVGIDSHEYVKCFQFSRVNWLSRRGNNMYRVFLLLSRCRLPNLENLGRTCNRLYFCHPKNELLNALWFISCLDILVSMQWLLSVWSLQLAPSRRKLGHDVWGRVTIFLAGYGVQSHLFWQTSSLKAPHRYFHLTSWLFHLTWPHPEMLLVNWNLSWQ